MISTFGLKIVPHGRMKGILMVFGKDSWSLPNYTWGSLPWVSLWSWKHISRGRHVLSVQFSSVAHSCQTLCDRMNRSMPRLPVHHQLPESTQTHVHCVCDAIQPPHPLLLPSPPALSIRASPPFPASGSFQMSQLFSSGGQSIGVSASTSVSSMNTQDWSPLGWTGWNSLQSKGLSRVFSKITVQKHQFFGVQLSL